MTFAEATTRRERLLGSNGAYAGTTPVIRENPPGGATDYLVAVQDNRIGQSFALAGTTDYTTTGAFDAVYPAV